jgi:predicted CoA-substrate-specific enzyme activase
MPRSLGICLGASSIKLAGLWWRNGSCTVEEAAVIPYEGNPKDQLVKEFKRLQSSRYDYICVTGRKAKDSVNLPKITEAEATEYALQHYMKETAARFSELISLGSENFVVYELDEKGHITGVRTGSKCASGTGEFFLQQIRRMNVELEEAIELAGRSEPYYVSGRCSVFCKSDCTHALNRGIPVGRVCAGLGNMVAEKILELSHSVNERPVILVGGVTKNAYIVNQLRKRIKHLVIPKERDIFEALGAALYAYHRAIGFTGHVRFDTDSRFFSSLPPLSAALSSVSFKSMEKMEAREGDECVTGLDVGSTTTKSVLLRTEDDSIIASVYLRTNGNPVKAARECYAEMARQLNGKSVSVIGLGVTGSGRQITGLHALTDGIITEILAHATAAAYFDPAVDTILEIGGQDAKYTYLVNGVPCDYAMNEACSAGTGSFLEEAAQESLDIDCLDIERIALRAKRPPDFNDQCAAFINSDIKNALQENVGREDIVAGLVYSICMNYNNRVKGQRKIGERIFMQGGVCYNRAVPLAMAILLEKQIIVPPEPGLMGAFGVALEIKNRIEAGILKEARFDLQDLAGREVEYGKSFTCSGKGEMCDRRCRISIIRLNGKNYTFGGACNRYYNLVHHLPIDPRPYDIVVKRQQLVFERYKQRIRFENASSTAEIKKRRVGIPKSLYVNTLFPLYYHFFTDLGFDVVLSDGVDPDGCKKVSSSFCFPVEIAHGVFQNLLNKNPDLIFLPHVAQLYVPKGGRFNTGDPNVCIMAEGEPYFFRSVFRDVDTKLISPILNFSRGWLSMEDKFVEVARVANRLQRSRE